MQLKGLVKFFTAALILVSLYQLSFTFAVRNVEKEAMAKAIRQVKAMNPQATGEELKLLQAARYEAITDSLQGQKVVNMIFTKYTFQQAKAQELNLGLDLQGGMNVAMDVSLDEFVRSQSNNPQDPALNKAIEDATKARATSSANFVKLFGDAFEKNNPGAKLAYLFIKPNDKEITLQSPNQKVLDRLDADGKEAIKSTYNIIQKRIDKFGVSQPNVTLDNNRGVITVELAGVRNPERVREFLQSTAKLQFWEMYNNPNLISSLEEADKIVAEHLGLFHEELASTIDTNKVASATTGNDSVKTDAKDTSLASLMNADNSTASAKDTGKAAKPLMALLSEQPTRESYSPAAFAYIRRSNIQKLNDYLKIEDVKNVLPSTAKILVAAEQGDEKFNPNAILAVYAVKTQSDGSAKLEGDQISNAYFDYDGGRPVVKMDMKSEGAEIWKKMTGDNVKGYVAVALDDRVYSAPQVENEIAGGSTQITVGNDPQQAQDLASILKIGKLPAPAHIVQEQIVGPTLGAENIKAGMNSLMIAFVIIFILMLVYYNTAGMVANIALILNVLFTIGILAALHATLTMPGIAGLVLTIGMAVDTNVIIFERIKEELAAGKSYSVAVADGYKRSYAPVLDGHITQLLTAIILFVFGLGPVKGFATTQIIGLLLSLFCGILVSRLITDAYTKKERHFKYFTSLSKSIFRKAHFKFIEKRKITYVVSAFIFLLGILSVFNGYDKGVEFSGGRSYTIRFDRKISENDLREKMKGYLNERPVVKTVGTNNDLNLTTTYRIDETGIKTDQAVSQKIYEGLTKEGLIPAATTFQTFESTYLKSAQKVEASISETLRKDSIKATIFSLIAIFFYILIRFRKWQYSLGTIFSLLHDVCIILAVFSFLRGKVPFALELDQHFIAAILTVIGFSMNDTVIVFDRVREYFRKNPGEDKKSVINRAINDTLSRTIMTSLTVFLTVLILFIFGGEVTRGFAFAMLIGVVTGTYSSIFVAAPFLVDMDRGDKLKEEQDKEARIAELRKLA